MAVVSLVAPAGEHLPAELRAGLKALLDPLGGVCIIPGESVLLYMGHIWPAPPALGVNPRPALLAALIEAAFEEGAGEVALAALAAPGFSFEQTWQMAGYGELESYGITLYDLSCTPTSARESRLNLAGAVWSVPQPLLKAEYLINVGKFRVAQGKLFGSAMGNLAAAANLPKHPQQFARALVDLHSIITPDLHVLDALRGERGYQLQERHAIFAAYDAVALDSTLAALAGLTAGEIEHLVLASSYGLGVANASDIRLLGADALESFGC